MRSALMSSAEKASRTPTRASARRFRTVTDGHERYIISLNLEELRMIRDTSRRGSSLCSSAPRLYHGCAGPGVGSVVSVDECDPGFPPTANVGSYRFAFEAFRVYCSAEMLSLIR